MSLRFGADGDLVDYTGTDFGSLTAGTFMEWIFPTSDTDRQSMWGANTNDECSAAFRGDQAGDPFECFMGRSSTYLSVATAAANFAAYALNKWIFFAFAFDTAGADGDQKMFMGDLLRPAAEPSSYTTPGVVGSGTVVTGATGYRWGNGGVTSREFKGLVGWAAIFNRYYNLSEIRKQQKASLFTDLPILPGNLLFSYPGMETGKGLQVNRARNAYNGVVTGTTLGPPLPRQQARKVKWKAPAAGTAFNRSLSESLGTNNPFQRLSDGNRSLSQNLGGSDAFARLSNALRIYADTTGESDTYARLSDALRLQTDNLGEQDAYSRMADGLRTYADSAGMQDAYARLTNALRLQTDNLGEQDTYTRVADALRSLADNLGKQDTYSRQSNALRALSDNAGLTDAYARLSDALRRITDTIGATDAYARLADALRQITNNLGLQDTATLVLVGAGALVLTVIENLGLQDSYARLSNALRVHTDTLGLTNPFTRVSDALRVLTESAGLKDEYKRVADTLRVLTDTLGLKEVVDLDLVLFVSSLIGKIFLTGNIQRNVAVVGDAQRNVAGTGNVQRNIALTGDAGAGA